MISLNLVFIIDPSNKKIESFHNDNFTKKMNLEWAILTNPYNFNSPSIELEKNFHLPESILVTQ